MQTKTTCLLLLWALAFLSGAQAQKYDPTLPDSIDALLQSQYGSNTPGIAVLAVRNDQYLYKKAFGMANIELDVPLRPDHVFRIGSISKQFTAAAIMQLAEQGKLSLQDELTAFIPDYPTHGKKITVEHLLTHTSGIKSYTEMEAWDDQVRRRDFTPAELVDYFKNEPMDFDPGTQYKYNNSGYVLLGFIIEKVTGQSYAEYVTEHFFKPLGMKNSYYGDSKPLIHNRATGYAEHPAGGYENADFLSMTQPYSAGSLLSTVEDLYIWTRALHSGKVVSATSLKKMTTPFVMTDGNTANYGYGLQMMNVLGNPTVEHSGGINGFLSDLVYLPENQICIAILTNCECPPPREISHRIAAWMLGLRFQPKVVSVDAASLGQYTGVYENDKKEQRIISVEDGRLYSKRIGGSKYKLLPYGPDQFFFDQSFARIQFVKAEKGDKKVIKAKVSDTTTPESWWFKTDKPIPADRLEVLLTEAQLEPFLGTYNLMPGFNITVTRENTRLFCQATGQPQFEVFAASPTRFFLKVVEADIEFYPDANGKVDKMKLFQGGQVIEGTRVK